MWRWEDVSRCKMRRCEKIWRWEEDVKMRRCADEKMREVCKWLVFYHCLRYSFAGTLRCPKCPSLRTTVRHWRWHLGLQDSMANRSFLALEVHPLLQIMNESGFPLCSQQHVELSRFVLFSFCVSRGNLVSDCSWALRNMLVTVGRAGTFCIGAK